MNTGGVIRPLPPWIDPWLHAKLTLRDVLEHLWDAAEWATLKPDIPELFVVERALRKDGRFN